MIPLEAMRRVERGDTTPYRLGYRDGNRPSLQFRRGSLEAVFNTYAQQLRMAQHCSQLTLAFTFSKPFASVFTKRGKGLNYILFDTEPKNFDADGRWDLRLAIGRTRGMTNSKLVTKPVGEGALTGLNVHVKYLHTKYLITDPFGPLLYPDIWLGQLQRMHPPETTTRTCSSFGVTSVVDIYLTEFM